MHYGILDQDLNQLRMGFANADPSELAHNVAFNILEVTDDSDILAYHKQYPNDYNTILTMHGFEIVPISEDIYQTMLDENIETAVVSEIKQNFVLVTSYNHDLFIFRSNHRSLKPSLLPRLQQNYGKRTHHLQQ